MSKHIKNFEDQSRYDRAKRKVEDEKKFYKHLTAYLIVNIFLILINSDFIDEGFSNWLDWNLYFTAFFWGIGLCIHWIKVFKPNIIFNKQWEERKIKEIMEEDDTIDYL